MPIDFSYQRKRTIPAQEDLPLILAWIKTCSDPLQRCELGKCRNQALYVVDEYEDQQLLVSALKRDITDEKVLEDMVWRKTVQEQMSNQFIIHNTFHICLSHQLKILMHFLNTQKPEELRELLTSMEQMGLTLIQFHLLSNPDDGLLAPMRCKTEQEFLAWLRSGVQINWKVGR